MKRSFRIRLLIAGLVLTMSLPLFACNDTPDEETAESVTSAVTESESDSDEPTEKATSTETESSKATETDGNSEGESGSDAQTETNSNTATETESTSGVSTESNTETQSDTDSESGSDTATESDSAEATDTESSADTSSTETESQDNSTETETESESEVEIETEFDPNSVIYGNGSGIANAGDKLADNAFALTDIEINEANAINVSAAELLSILASKTEAAEGRVYRVTEPIVLESDTKYYGNLACVIAEGGIIVKDADNIVVKELVVKGSITVENSSDLTLFKIIVSSDTDGVTIDESSSNIAIKNCRISANGTAITNGADTLSLYQSYVSADKAIVSTGDSMVAQSNRIVAISLGISSSGSDCVIKNNSVDCAIDGIGVELAEGSVNSLVALNTLTGAQISVRAFGGFNCSVILNSLIRLNASNNVNLYVIDNNLGGAVELTCNKYLVCDGNTFAKDGKPHPVIATDNTLFNGDNLHDVDARLEVGADEDLLPHTNKDLFIGMERKGAVSDLSQTKSLDLNTYIRNIAKNESVVIVPPGAYSISSTLNIQSSHSNTTIYAYGVYQEATKYIKNLDLSNTSSVTVKGLTIGYKDQSAGQIQILDKLGDNKLLVISSAGFSKDFGQTDSTKFSSGGYFYHTGSYTSWTEIGNWGKYVIIPNESGETFNEDGTFTIQIGGGKDAVKYYALIGEGDILTCRLNETNDRTVAISGCTNVLFKDTVTYGYADALCFVIGGTSTGVEFYRHHNLAHSAYEIDRETYDKYVALEETYKVDLEVYIDEYGRCRGADPRIGSVDATHVTGSSQGLTATSTLFENACDDASNQRGNSSRLHDVIDNEDGTVTLLYKDYLPETYVNLYINQGKTEIHPGHQVSSFAKGDRIFIYASNGKVFCDATVLTASQSYQTNVVIYEQEYMRNGQKYTLTWKSTIFAVKVKSTDVNMDALEGYDLTVTTPDMSNKIIVDNLSRNSVNFTFDNCMVRNNRGRFVIKTRDANITNCTFKNNSMAGVVLSVESTWGESSVPRNVTISKCLFDGTSQTFNYDANTKYAAIAVEGLGSGGASVTVSADSIPAKNITIEDCVFRNVPNNYYVTVSAAQSVTIQNNVFEARSTESDKKVGKAIYINGCLNIDISGNTYSEFARGDVSKVIVANNYKNLHGSDVEGVLDADKEPVTEAATEAN